MTYGVFMGRFQPLHLGHQLIINEIIQDGLEPLLFVGSTNKPQDARNPLSYRQRVELIQEVYGKHYYIEGMRDHEDWATWREDTLDLLRTYSPNLRDFVLYFHVKPEDITDFSCGNCEYRNAHYSRVFDGICTTYLAQLPVKFPLPVHATNIRADLEGNRQYLDGRVYRKLKEWGW